MSPHPDDLTVMKDDMTAFIEGLGMRRFFGYVECEEVPSVLWDSEHNPDGWKDFVELAKSTGAPFLTMHSWTLEREELERLSQRLADGDYRSEEDLEESRWLKTYLVRWISNPLNSPKARVLEAALHDSNLKISSSALPVLADLLVGRGIDEPDAAARFLSPQLADLHDPLLMSGMKSAVDRLEAAIERKEKVLIYGDYDVDGTTAIVILKTAIELCGGAADFHVPHRIREGYGMRDEVIERAAAEGVRLIISVDTGIRGFAAAETARRTGVDLIVTDHHLPGMDGVPQALAVVNPNQDGCDYPCKHLCGAGVAFKLAHGLMQRRLDPKDQSRLLMSFMKVVAIATIADAVPLLGENRVFAKLGLQGLRSPVNVGLKALLEVAKLGGARAKTAGEVAFRIAPRLNAAGRMDVALDVIDLFSVKDP